MKRLIVLCLIFLFNFVFGASADIFNNGTVYHKQAESLPATGDVIGIFEDYTHVTIVWRFTYVDSSDKYHSKPIYIGNCNVADGYVNAIQSTTGDANVIYHFSADNRQTWQTTTAADLDAVSSTAKLDTIGVEAGTNDIRFHTARWLVIEAASGSSTNADDNVFTIVIMLTKNTSDAILPSGGFQYISSVSNVSRTNP